MTSQPTAQDNSIIHVSDSIVITVVDLLDQFSEERIKLAEILGKALLNLAKSRKAGMYASFASPDDIRSDIDPMSLVSMNDDGNYSLATEESEFNSPMQLFSALPNRNLRLAATDFKRSLEVIVRLASVTRTLQGAIGLKSNDEEIDDDNYNDSDFDGLDDK